MIPRWSRRGSASRAHPNAAASVAAALLVACAVAAPSGARAQSILAAQGYGFPVEPISARARGMGSLGVGLFGADLLPGDPAAARGLQVPLITATYQPSWTSYTLADSSRSTSASRFPLMGVAYPVAPLGGMATLSFGGVLDENWQSVTHRTLNLGGDSVAVTDRFQSTGGISALRLGWAQSMGPDLDLAISVGTYLGENRRFFVRSFDQPSSGNTIQPSQAGGQWRYSGPTVAVGAAWEPNSLVRVGASVDWSGALHATPVDSTTVTRASVDLPIQYRLGVSGALSPRLFLNLGFSYADWSSADPGLNQSSTVGSVVSWGGGLEWRGALLMRRSLPLRIGYRHSDLPFRFQGANPTESAFSLGAGLNLLATEQLPLAAVDLAFERGSRKAGSYSESFNRATVTIRVGGF